MLSVKQFKDQLKSNKVIIKRAYSREGKNHITVCFKTDGIDFKHFDNNTIKYKIMEKASKNMDFSVFNDCIRLWLTYEEIPSFEEIRKQTIKAYQIIIESYRQLYSQVNSLKEGEYVLRNILNGGKK